LFVVLGFFFSGRHNLKREKNNKKKKTNKKKPKKTQKNPKKTTEEKDGSRTSFFLCV